MKRFLNICLAAFIITISSAQTQMNIYLNNGTVIQIPLNTIDSITYTIQNPGSLPTLTTTVATAITKNSAVSGGDVISNGGSTITHRGVCYSTSPNPTTANDTTYDGLGLGSFTSTLSNLTDSTTYYIRAYAINSAGTAYGNQLIFTTLSGNYFIQGPGVTDIDGNFYPTVIYSNGMEWMASNLRTTRYSTGDTILAAASTLDFFNLSSNGGWIYYNMDSSYNIPFGKLYNGWAAADTRNICPFGWHVPSLSEWINFRQLVWDSIPPINSHGSLKSAGTQYWLPPNLNATNLSGFSALPAGTLAGLNFNFIGSITYFHCSTSVMMTISYNTDFLSYTNKNMDKGYSCRCIKD